MNLFVLYALFCFPNVRTHGVVQPYDEAQRDRVLVVLNKGDYFGPYGFECHFSQVHTTAAKAEATRWESSKW